MHDFSIKAATPSEKMMKYMRYVLNDHLFWCCLFLVGGLAFYYSNLLKQLPTDFPWSLPIVGIIWWFILPFGKLATLVEPADMTFLLPKKRKWGTIYRAVYVIQSLFHS